ncbi:MAG: enoyl-CoA hydratase/isomerase family protein [Acidobacteria bacterium]|nr:enoyl-CoA hydratase/isomerase family protein [Acidobacteriota bacterium]
MVEVLTDEVYGGEPKKEREPYKLIRWQLRDGQAHLTLNRPPHNYLNAEMLTEMALALESLHEHPEVKVVLIEAGKDAKFFCGGVDLPEYTTQRVFQMLDAFARVFRASLDVGKPIVVAVNGPALGGGCELAAFGDMVIATPKAKFSQPEIKLLGMFPPFATSTFPYIIGPKRAMEMLLTGEPITAEEALELGLVNKLVPEAQLEKTVDELVSRIAQHSAPVLAMTKKAIYEGLGMSLTESLKHSHHLFLNELYKLEDSQEGLRAILEKRKPQWKNR